MARSLLNPLSMLPKAADRVTRLVFAAVTLLSGFAAPRASGEWVWRNPAPQGDGLYSVAYGNNQFVAVGLGGRVMTSKDGMAWTVSKSGVPGNLLSVAFGNRIYVAFGALRNLGGVSEDFHDYFGGYVLTSADGITWRPVLKGQFPFGRVSFQNGKFFLNLGEGQNLTSEDGEHWREWNVESSPRITSDVTFANESFMALEGLRVFTSPDGTNWTAGRLLVSQGGSKHSMAYGKGTIVAVGGITPQSGVRTVHISTNGVAWRARNVGTEATLNSVVFAAGVFVAVGEGGTILRSEDGENWTAVTTQGYEDFKSVTYGSGQFLVIGSGGEILTSTDGMDWVWRSQGTRTHLNGITYANSQFVAVGGMGLGVILTSPDARNWSEQLLIRASPLLAVAAFQGRFIAVGGLPVGRAGTIATATDTSQWDVPDIDLPNTLRGVTGGPDGFVVVGNRGIIMTSVDGFNWTSQLSPEPEARLRAVTYGGGRYVAVGDSARTLKGISLTSDNGIQWVFSELEYGYPLFGVAYGNGRYVSVGAFRLFVSDDGVNWQRVASNLRVYPRAVAFGGGRFVAVGEAGAILSSVNGRNWTQEPSPTAGSLTAVTYGDGSFVAVGNGGTILESETQPVLEVINPQIRGAEFAFIIAGKTGLRYQVQVSTNLSAPNWLPIGEGVLTESPRSFVDTNALTRPARFYRALPVP